MPLKNGEAFTLRPPGFAITTLHTQSFYARSSLIYKLVLHSDSISTLRYDHSHRFVLEVSTKILLYEGISGTRAFERTR